MGEWEWEGKIWRYCSSVDKWNGEIEKLNPYRSTNQRESPC